MNGVKHPIAAHSLAPPRYEIGCRLQVAGYRLGSQLRGPAGAAQNEQNRTPGFTLIEMIGALAVVAILASLLIPVVVRQIDNAAWNQEVTNVGAISNAVVLQAIRNKIISSASTWQSDASQWLNLPTSSVATNPRGFPRAFLIDTSGWFGSTPAPLPYRQGPQGTNFPNNARVMIVSTIATGLPVASGTLSASAFNDIWITPDRKKPTDSSGSIWGSWKGRGEDLVIQRINLQQLFHRVILYNRGAINVYFGLDTNISQVTVINQWDAYYLTGSQLDLYETNSTTLISSEMINSDLSRIYQSSAWSDDIGVGPASTVTSNLDSLAYGFVTSQPTNATRAFSAALTGYMNTYSSWANTCFSYGGAGNLQDVAQYQLLNGILGCFVQKVGNGNGNGNSSTQPGPCAIVQ